MSAEINADYESRGLHLLKKGQKGIVHAVFSRLGLIVFLLAVQVMVLFGVFQWFEEFLPHILGERRSLLLLSCYLCSIIDALILHLKLHG